MKNTICTGCRIFQVMDGRGLEGIEFYYDSYLKGADYQLTVLKDALGRGFGVEKSWDPITAETTLC